MVKVHWTLKELLADYPRPWSLAHVRDPGAYPYVIYDARGLVIPARIPERLIIELVEQLDKPKSPQKPQTFREGMLVCATIDPEDPNSHDVLEVLAATPDGIYCRDEEGLYLPFFPDEYEKCRIFEVGHVEPGWFGRKRWVYGVQHRTFFFGVLPPHLNPDPHPQ